MDGDGLRWSQSEKGEACPGMYVAHVQRSSPIVGSSVTPCNTTDYHFCSGSTKIGENLQFAVL